MAKASLSSYATGGGGYYFEHEVATLFAVAMLANIPCPYYPNSFIESIEFQAGSDEYMVDDIVLNLSDALSGRSCQSRIQVRRNVTLTSKNKDFKEIVVAAWTDYSSESFNRDADQILVICHHMSIENRKALEWISDQVKSRGQHGSDAFFRSVQTERVPPPNVADALDAIRSGINEELNNEELYAFLRCFSICQCDLDTGLSAIRPLAMGHLNKCFSLDADSIWSQIHRVVAERAKMGTSLSPKNHPESWHSQFEPKEKLPFFKLMTSKKVVIAEMLSKAPPDQLNLIAPSTLLGSWSGTSDNDMQIIKKLLGERYQDFEKVAQLWVQKEESPLKIMDGTWFYKEREILFEAVANFHFNESMERFVVLACEVLSDKDTSLDMPKEERYLSSLYGKGSKYSPSIKKGVTESLILISRNKRTLSNVTVALRNAIVFRILNSVFRDVSDWKMWASLDYLLPNLAQANPNFFLSRMEDALDGSPNVFLDIFNEEDAGITGRTYMSGMLWALERLAWKRDYLGRVTDILLRLSDIDPGGQWANRPMQSLARIFVSWKPQTLASVNERKIILANAFDSHRQLAWELMFEHLLLIRHQISIRSNMPEFISDVEKQLYDGAATWQDYYDQVSFCSNLLIDDAKNQFEKMPLLLMEFERIPMQERNELAKYLIQFDRDAISPILLVQVWETLTNKIGHHRKYARSDWAFASEELEIWEAVAERFAPQDAAERYRRLFSLEDYKLFDVCDDFEVKSERLAKKRVEALNVIVDNRGSEFLIEYSTIVGRPEILGMTMAMLDNDDFDQLVIPNVGASASNLKRLVGGYVWQKYVAVDFEWIDKVLAMELTDEQVGDLLSMVPLSDFVLERLEGRAQESVVTYWTKVDTRTDDFAVCQRSVVDGFLAVGRMGACLEFLAMEIHRKRSVSVELCIEVLMNPAINEKVINQLRAYDICELVKYIQKSAGDEDEIASVEWRYLPLLGEFSEVKPLFLFRQMNENPDFFLEVVSLAYKTDDGRDIDNISEVAVSFAWRLLNMWNILPGTRGEEAFDGLEFASWFDAVNALAEEQKYLNGVNVAIGAALIHAGADKSGLWLDKQVAQILDSKGRNIMRSSYTSALFSSRGIYDVDPSGNAERDIAKKYDERAAAVDKEGFYRLGAALRELADDYRRDGDAIEARELYREMNN